MRAPVISPSQEALQRMRFLRCNTTDQQTQESVSDTIEHFVSCYSYLRDLTQDALSIFTFEDYCFLSYLHGRADERKRKN